MSENNTLSTTPSDPSTLSEREAEDLLVFGERRTVKGVLTTHYPSYRELGDRFGVSHTTIARLSEKLRCLERRKQVQEAIRCEVDYRVSMQRAQELTEERLARVLSYSQLRDTIASTVEAFREALAEGSIEIKKISDFDRMVRLELELRDRAEAEASGEGEGEFNLATLQEYHAEMLERLHESQKNKPRSDSSEAR